jgi:hypothetical protein
MPISLTDGRTNGRTDKHIKSKVRNPKKWKKNFKAVDYFHFLIKYEKDLQQEPKLYFINTS